ncbi:DUF4870 domain-containing protein [Thalassobacillus sp. CUG 92003]|uniref:DUF4870 domain-containing protein n=1 Tax=Thalassobacillus sp. CUG 92003 TaxID=2736641 RepID=UPI0015E68233|nr:hypothetical protein [Thalassobacillus sp. CUG 92003]
METEEVKQTAINQDAEDNKGMGILAYIIFFIPLLAAKESKFAMYHANQGLLLLLTAVGVNVVGTIIPIIGWLFILPFGNLLVFILAIIGIISAAKGEMKPLPVIGKYTLIKTPEQE